MRFHRREPRPRALAVSLCVFGNRGNGHSGNRSQQNAGVWHEPFGEHCITPSCSSSRPERAQRRTRRPGRRRHRSSGLTRRKCCARAKVGYGSFVLRCAAERARSSEPHARKTTGTEYSPPTSVFEEFLLRKPESGCFIDSQGLKGGEFVHISELLKDSERPVAGGLTVRTRSADAFLK
jgi:hypothetical protein